jgi:hypothetical protein
MLNTGGDRTDTEEIDEYRNHIPCDHWPRSDQQAIVDPDNLRDTGDCGHSGFMPVLDRRLSIASRSGMAAKVVPKPAIKPSISDR